MQHHLKVASVFGLAAVSLASCLIGAAVWSCGSFQDAGGDASDSDGEAEVEASVDAPGIDASPSIDAAVPDAAASEKRLYVLGGNVPDAGRTDAVRSIAIDADGGAPTGVWREEKPLPAAIYKHSVAVVGRTIIVIGGFGASAPQAAVLVGTADDQGRIGQWQGVSVVSSGGESAVVSDGHFVHLISGQRGGSYTTEVVAAPLDNAGLPGTFVPTTSLPEARGLFGAVRIDDTILAVGGISPSDAGSGFVTRGDSVAALVGADGGIAAWSAGPSLDIGLENFAAVGHGQTAYAIGGFGSTVSSAVHASTRIGPGSMSPWASSTPLPAPRYAACAATVRRFLYVIGGFDESNAETNTVELGTFSFSGSNLTWGTSPVVYPVSIADAACAAL